MVDLVSTETTTTGVRVMTPHLCIHASLNASSIYLGESECSYVINRYVVECRCDTCFDTRIAPMYIHHVMTMLKGLF